MSTRSIAAWLIPWVIIIGSLIFLYPEPNSRSGAVQNLSYGEFMDQVDRGNIATITINDTGEIEGNLKQPIGNAQKFSSRTLSADMNYAEALRKDIRSKNPDAVINLRKNNGSFWDNLFGMFPLILLIGFWIWFMKRAQGQQMNAMNSFIKPRTRLAKDHDKKTFQDVAGAEEAKEDLKEIVGFLKDPQKFQRLGAHIPKGVILMGPPGTGKTLLARAVAGEANVPFFSISGSDFVEMFVGVGASRVRDLFEQGKNNAPCIVFIDEIDAVGRHRGAGLGGGHDEREQTLNALLVEMDGFASNEGVILIAATNRPDVLDPALLRPGRFDRRVVVNKPDLKGREGILIVHTTKIPLSDETKSRLSEIARGTVGFSGADLANLANEAALNAARYNRKLVEIQDFEFAKDKVLMGSERRSMIISEEEKRITAIHEAGHALLAAILPHADPIHKVTIIPRGMALGLTQQLPIDDKHNYSEPYLKDMLVILFGGRVAEEIENYGIKTTGAQNDLERATDLARRMVCEWGMSEEMGPLTFGKKEEQIFLGREFAQHQDYSENTASRIDKEVKGIIDRAYEKAKKLILDRRDYLKQIAGELLKKEELTGDDVRKIVNPPKTEPQA